MSVKSDPLSELRDENKRLLNDLSHEKKLNEILDNIRNFSLILINHCKCEQNLDVLDGFWAFNESYDDLKTSQTTTEHPKQDATQTSKKSEVTKDDGTCDPIGSQDIAQTSDNNTEEKRRSDNAMIVPNCEQCGEMFDSDSDLRQHEESVHKHNDKLQEPQRHSSLDSDSDIEMIIDESEPSKSPQKSVIQSTNTRKPIAEERSVAQVIQNTPRPQPVVTSNGHPVQVVKKINVLNASPLDFYSISQSIARQLVQNNSQLNVSSSSVSNTVANRVSPKKLQCTRCNLRFKSEVKCETHMNRDHLNVRPYSCQLCSNTFYAKDSLSNHMYIKHRLAAFECHICGHKTTQKMALMLHMGTHTTEKPFKCDLPGCDKSFATKVHLYHHKRNLHNVRQSFGDFTIDSHESSHSRQRTNSADKNRTPISQATTSGASKASSSAQKSNNTEEVVYTMCDECDELFDSDLALKQHSKVHQKTTVQHQKSEPPKQSQSKPQIGLKTYSKNSNTSNINTTDKNIVSFICRKCKQFFNNSELFVRHVSQDNCRPKAQFTRLSAGNSTLQRLLVMSNGNAVDVTPRPVQSTLRQPIDSNIEIESNQVVVDLSDNNDNNNNEGVNNVTIEKISHTATTSALKYECNECNMKFDIDWKLETHQNRDHYNVKPFACDQCDMRFHAKETLCNHLYQKHTIRAFECHICGHKAGLRSALDVHMGRHRTERPFKCDSLGCDKTFKTKVNLYYHKKGSHQPVRTVTALTAQSVPNKWFVCNRTDCERKFKTKAELTQHQNTHHLRISCNWPGCQFGAESLTILLEHKRKEHTNP